MLDNGNAVVIVAKTTTKRTKIDLFYVTTIDGYIKIS